MKIWKNSYPIIISMLFLVIQSCLTYSTDFNKMETITKDRLETIKEGTTCSHNLFGGFTLPYFGDTAIRLSGTESVMAAIKDKDVTHVYAIDRTKRNYIFYSKRCTMVYGR